MSTSPFDATTEALLAESHRQVVRARATHPNFSAPMELDLEDCSLSWDGARAPRVQASLTCKVPETVADLAVIDPRLGVRVEIDCGYILPGGEEDVQTIADLGLRQIKVSRPDNRVLLECASDEALLIDASPAANASTTGATTAAAITDLIGQGISPAPMVTSSVTGPSVTVDPVTDRFETVRDLADRVNAKVYDDGLRDWFIVPAPTVAATPNMSLTVGEGGTILDSDSTLTRDGWFNYVYLRYRWTNTSGVDQSVQATAAINEGPFAITGPSGKRIYMEEREVPTTQAEANAAAAALLDRFMTRSTTYSLSSIAAYWLRPGQTVSVTLPLAPAAKHLVERITFRPLLGTMDLETREDTETYTAAPITTTPTSGGSVPDPEPPAAQTYTTVWTANASQTYKQGGSQNTFTTDAIQGYYDSTNGNQQAVILFTGTATSGSHSGQSITTALSGATVSKVEVYLYANHWYYNGGGTARIGKYGGTTIPSTYTGAAPYVTATGWQAGSGRWVTITSSALITELLSGFCRGVTVGPGVGTDRTYYGKFNGAAASSGKPQLRITYAK